MFIYIYESLLSTIHEANSVHAQFALNRFSFQNRTRSLESCTHLVTATKQGFSTTKLNFNSYKRAVLEA